MDPQLASKAVQLYRLGFEDLVRGPVQRDLQDAFVRLGPQHSSAELVTNGGAPLLSSVSRELRRRLAPHGIIVQDLTLVGAPALPESIRNRINARIEAEQNAATQEQQVRVVEAQARQRVAEAQGRAQALTIEGAAIRANPEVLRIRAIEKWSGQCPLDATTCVLGGQALVNAGN
jgi:regulator of protease activity HflC (stomatin/prohibitin superfamily)